MLRKFLSSLRRAYRLRRHRADLRLMHESGFFDAGWYLSNNPDVARSGVDPALHYLLHGAFEGRDPGPAFRSLAYLSAHDGLRRSGQNPLIHFLKSGGLSVLPKSGLSGRFLRAYVMEVAACAYNWWEDNDPIRRYDPQAQGTRRVPGDLAQSIRLALELLGPNLNRFEWLYAALADQPSRDILVKVLAYRALGYRRVKLPLNTPAYWEELKRLRSLADSKQTLTVEFQDWPLSLMDLHPIGIPFKFYTRPASVTLQFIREQYRCDDIAVGPGDYVVDGGASWGETALYFARRAGSAGRVFSFEIVPQTLRIMRQNLALNPGFEQVIEVVERALWSESDIPLSFEAAGSATRVAQEVSGERVAHTPSLSLDDLVTRNRLPRLDFIKLHVEGAELRALQGAVQTLRRFRPKLAVAAYHNLTDLLDIPEFLDSLELGYRSSLRHPTIDARHTVLFAAANQSGSARIGGHEDHLVRS